MDPLLDEWSEFNVAMAGATAALGGLVIVASSVNIERIVKAGPMTSRLGAAIAVLVLALVVAGVGLVPDMPVAAYGWIVVAATAAATVFQYNAAWQILHDRWPYLWARFLKITVGFVPVLAYLVGGILVIVGVDGGLAVLAAACMLAIISALLISWVVLVEVLR